MSEEEQILAALEASLAGSKPAPSKTESRSAVVNLDEDEEEPILLDEDDAIEGMTPLSLTLSHIS
jgi:hypothetical protein